MHISREYASNTLESCRTVSVPTTGEFALNFMCGNVNALKCTSDQFFEFLGFNPFSPFRINFKLQGPNDTDPNGLTPPDMKTFACWEAPDVSLRADELSVAERLNFNLLLIIPCPLEHLGALFVRGLRWSLSDATRLSPETGSVGDPRPGRVRLYNAGHFPNRFFALFDGRMFVLSPTR